MPLSNKRAFLYATLCLALWWLVLPLFFSFLIENSLAVPPDVKFPSGYTLASILVIAPIVENAVMVGVLVFTWPSHPIRSAILVSLLAALCHLAYDWRALTAAGVFAVMAWYYQVAEQAGPWRAYAASCILHMSFNAASLLAAANQLA